MRCCVLRPGKEKALWQRHPWIFSGAIEELSDCAPGELLPVYSARGELLATAYFQPEASLTGRVVAWGSEPAQDAVRRHVRQACSLRDKLRPPQTNAFRLINAEGDSLPGLIVDQYANVLVLQINTMGMELLKPIVLEELRRLYPNHSIQEKSSASVRVLEGMPKECRTTWHGPTVTEVEIEEYGIRFLVDLVGGQKTGFFLDQREERRRIEGIASGRRVLNCFAYSGGFSLYALRGGAREVTTVDASGAALQLFQRNLDLNDQLAADRGTRSKAVEADVFEFLRGSDLPYDLIILDPPAFAKKHADVPAALRGYKDLNRQAMKAMPSGSLLLTCSCSGHITQGLFQQAMFQAAVDADREVRVLGRHVAAIDHPVSIFHPEGEYLKSLLLWIE